MDFASLAGSIWPSPIRFSWSSISILMDFFRFDLTLSPVPLSRVRSCVAAGEGSNSYGTGLTEQHYSPLSRVRPASLPYYARASHSGSGDFAAAERAKAYDAGLTEQHYFTLSRVRPDSLPYYLRASHSGYGDFGAGEGANSYGTGLSKQHCDCISASRETASPMAPNSSEPGPRSLETTIRRDSQAGTTKHWGGVTRGPSPWRSCRRHG